MTAAEGGIVTTSGDTTSSPTSLANVIYTSVSREQMEAAAAALLARCTGREVILADASPVDLLALIFGGIAEGAPAEMNGLEGVVTKEFDGLYSIKSVGGDTEMRLAVRQQGNCRFLFTAGQVGDQEFSAKLDANLISTITVAPDGERGALVSYRVTIEGEEGRLLVETENGWEPAESASSSLTTSLTIDQIEAAIAVFRTTYCPGLAT